MLPDRGCQGCSNHVAVIVASIIAVAVIIVPVIAIVLWLSTSLLLAELLLLSLMLSFTIAVAADCKAELCNICILEPRVCTKGQVELKLRLFQVATPTA